MGIARYFEPGAPFVVKRENFVTLRIVPNSQVASQSSLAELQACGNEQT